MNRLLPRWFRMPVVLAASAAVVFLAALSWSLMTFSSPVESTTTAPVDENVARTADLPPWHKAHAAFFKAEVLQASFVTPASSDRAHPVVYTAAWTDPSPHQPRGLIEKKKRVSASEIKPSRPAAADRPGGTAGQQEEKKEPKHSVDPAPATYVGSAKCMSCHISQGETFSKRRWGGYS